MREETPCSVGEVIKLGFSLGSKFSLVEFPFGLFLVDGFFYFLIIKIDISLFFETVGVNRGFIGFFDMVRIF